mgnify:CR=1 FL=1|jgi:hypothetical protein
MKNTVLRSYSIEDGAKFSVKDIDEAHKLYKAKGGEYGRTGGFLNRGPIRALDDNLWQTTLNELYSIIDKKGDS